MSHSTAALPGGSAAATNGGDASAKVGFWSLALGSIGVVYGDIGTSPLYALREAVLAATGSGNPASETGCSRHSVPDHLGVVARRDCQIRSDFASR